MVARNLLIFFFVTFFILGCRFIPDLGSVKNLYGNIFKPEDLDRGSLSLIRSDGYYYRIYNNIDGHRYITFFILFKNGYSIGTSYRFETFQDFEVYLTSTSFFDAVSALPPSVFNLNLESKIIIQHKPIGGDTFSKHIATEIYEIQSKNELKLTQVYEIEFKEIKEIFRFKEFSKIDDLFYKLIENEYFNRK